MNENDQTNVPPVMGPSAAPTLPAGAPSNLPNSRPPRPLSWWLRKFFACNPFYLVSAALLLYGCYRISLDAPFLHGETAELIFNFSSVQVYEILLVLVAIFLARRSLWYDSTLLTGLENMLVFVPFILISQAALTDTFMTQVMCSIGVAVAILRFGSLRRFFKQLNLPDRLLEAGFILLVLNVGLPLLYRYLEDTKYGTHLDFGPAYDTNERVWLLMMPIAVGLANLLPPVTAKGDLLPQHRWLPTGLFSLWIVVTGVHLYSLDYVYEYYIRPDLFAPAALMLAWTVFLRCPANPVWFKYALLFPPIVVPLLAESPGSARTFLVLAVLNIAGYGAVSVFNRHIRIAPHLVFASVLLLVAGLPDNWMRSLVPRFTQGECVAGGIAAYLICWIARLRNPKLAIFGAIILGYLVAAICDQLGGSVHWALQGAFVFFLLHSLRWTDSEHAGASGARMLAGLAWSIQSFVWMNSDDGRFWLPFIPGVMVLGIYCMALPMRGIWRLAVVPAAALLVMLSGPCSVTVDGIRSAPVGLLAVIGSFMFLGIGTLAALTRELWHHHENDLRTSSRGTMEEVAE